MVLSFSSMCCVPVQEAITDGLEIAVSPRSLHSELMCPICLDMLKNTMTTKECLHRFCADCIITALRSGWVEPWLHQCGNSNVRRDEEMFLIVHCTLGGSPRAKIPGSFFDNNFDVFSSWIFTVSTEIKSVLLVVRSWFPKDLCVQTPILMP